MKFNDAHSGIESFSFINSSGQVETTVDLNAYPKILIATMECLVANDGMNAVSVERFEPSYFFRYSNTTWMGILNLLPIAGVYADDYSPAKLPYRLTPGEEAVFLLNVLWPLEDKALAQFEEACPGAIKSGSILGGIVSCLQAHGLKLNDNIGWRGTRKLSILVWQAGGKKTHASVHYELDQADIFM
jgi:hypothetical protein